MFKITKQERDNIVQYLMQSVIPAKDAIQIIGILNGLPEINEKSSIKTPEKV